MKPLDSRIFSSMLCWTISLLLIFTALAHPSLKGLDAVVESVCTLTASDTRTLLAMYESYLIRVQASYHVVKMKYITLCDELDVPQLWSLLIDDDPKLIEHQEKLKRLKLTMACKNWLGISYTCTKAQFWGGLFELFLRILPIQRFDLLNLELPEVIRIMSELRLMNYRQVHHGEKRMKF